MQKNAFPRRTLLLGAALGLSMPLLQACGGGDDPTLWIWPKATRT